MLHSMLVKQNISDNDTQFHFCGLVLKLWSFQLFCRAIISSLVWLALLAFALWWLRCRVSSRIMWMKVWLRSQETIARVVLTERWTEPFIDCLLDFISEVHCITRLFSDRFTVHQLNLMFWCFHTAELLLAFCALLCVSPKAHDLQLLLVMITKYLL